MTKKTKAKIATPKIEDQAEPTLVVLDETVTEEVIETKPERQPRSKPLVAREMGIDIVTLNALISQGRVVL